MAVSSPETYHRQGRIAYSLLFRLNTFRIWTPCADRNSETDELRGMKKQGSWGFHGRIVSRDISPPETDSLESFIQTKHVSNWDTMCRQKLGNWWDERDGEGNSVVSKVACETDGPEVQCGLKPSTRPFISVPLNTCTSYYSNLLNVSIVLSAKWMGRPKGLNAPKSSLVSVILERVHYAEIRVIKARGSALTPPWATTNGRCPRP